VEAALAAADSASEIVVADNSDEPLDLPSNDARLRHLHPVGRVLSMPDNWERALAAARGQWIMLLADKYMLVPGAIRALRQLVASGHELVTYGYAVLRQQLSWWEAEDPDRLAQAGGELALPPDLQPGVVRSSVALNRLVGSVRYPSEYPMLYTAVASRRLVDDAGACAGRFFLGSCPDVASALQLLASSRSYLFTQVPVVLVQYPGEPQAWSTGGAAVAGGALLGRYLRELGPAALPDPAERSVSGAILETMRAVLQARADLDQGRLGWREFAKHASREIEGLVPGRLRRHIDLARYLLRNGQGPGSVWAQVRAAAGVHAPARLRALWLQQRRTSPDDWTPATTAVSVESRAEALDLAANLIARKFLWVEETRMPPHDFTAASSRPSD